MLKALTLSWLVGLREVLVIAFGIIAIVSAMFIFSFGVFIISFSVPVLARVVGIAAVVVGLVWLGLAALTLFYFIVAWPIVTGSARAIGTLRLRQVIDNKGVLVTGGLFPLAF